MRRRGASRRGAPAERRAEELRIQGSLYDPISDLYAAPAMLESVRGLLIKARSVGVMHIEIDPASRVETVYGWQVLDGILRTVAEELRALRADLLQDEAVICQSGVHSDRFLVFFPLGPPTQEAEPGLLSRASLEIQQRLERRFDGADFSAMTPGPCVCVGTATVAEHPFFRIERQIYRGVDEARLMGMKGEAREHARRQAELKGIIRDQRIEILFQPILNLDDGGILGYEAFTRGPRGTAFEAPNVLFDSCRELGMAGELDLMCQRATLRQARRLSTGDKLFLNALPGSLLDPGFRESLLAELPAGFPIRREDIVLEIADRSSIDDYEAFGSEITDLRQRGFRVSIDDVGKGTSSLECLTEVNPDFIKVDGSLIRNIHRNPLKQEILRHLCQFARTIDAIVIAEGIEVREELEAVRRCGAHYGQGYLFSRPSVDLPAQELRAQRGEM